MVPVRMSRPELRIRENGDVNRTDYAETAAMLRRLLDAVDRGELTASTPQALALMRRMEGAAATLEVLSDK